MKVKLCVRAGHVASDLKGENVSIEETNRTINGRHYSAEPLDKTKPATVKGRCYYDFGRGHEFLATWNPETKTWTNTYSNDICPNCPSDDTLRVG